MNLTQWILRSVAVVVLLGGALSASASSDTWVGINYFAGWWPETPNKWLQTDGSDWRPKFPGRVPQLGQYNDAATLDREIIAASEHGVDFFAFLWYPIAPSRIKEPHVQHLNDGLALFQKSAEAHRMKFMVEICNHRPFDIQSPEEWSACIPVLVQAMKHPCYLRVGGKAVLKMHSGWGFVEPIGKDPIQARAWLDQLRQAARDAGVGELLIGGGIGASEVIPANYWVAKLYDFTACYMSVPQKPMQAEDLPYEELAGPIAVSRDCHAHDVIPHIPFLAAGWNPRPWTTERRAAYAFPTAVQWRKELQQIRDDLAAKPMLGLPLGNGKLQKILTIYAWNEFGEGGIVAPTQGEGTMKLDEILACFGKSALATGVQHEK